MKGVFLLTRLQYEFLRQYRNEHLPSLSSLSKEDCAIFKSCLSDHYIKYHLASDRIAFPTISPSGLAAMLEFENQLQEHAEEQARHEEERRADREQAVQYRKEDRRHDLKILILGALIAFVLDLINNLICAHL